MRTHEEIRRRVAELSENDFFGFQRGDLLGCLPREEMPAKLLEGLEADYKALPADRENVIARMRDYMPFALDKAEDHRGLSASRSISHFQAWTWLLGDEDYRAIDWDRYGPYGVPILKQLCEKYGFAHEFSGVLEPMAKGEPCSGDCEGCTG